MKSNDTINNKKFSQNQTQQNRTQTLHNSASDVSLGFEKVDLSGDRMQTTVRINRKLWKEFLKSCKKKGFSSCDVIENFISGFVYACSKPDVNSPTITVNVMPTRFVSRAVRRYACEHIGYASEHIGGEGGRFVDFYDGEATVWKRVKVEDDFQVNGNGHFVGCACSVCQRGGSKR